MRVSASVRGNQGLDTLQGAWSGVFLHNTLTLIPLQDRPSRPEHTGGQTNESESDWPSTEGKTPPGLDSKQCSRSFYQIKTLTKTAPGCPRIESWGRNGAWPGRGSPAHGRSFLIAVAIAPMNCGAEAMGDALDSAVFRSSLARTRTRPTYTPCFVPVVTAACTISPLEALDLCCGCECGAALTLHFWRLT